MKKNTIANLIMVLTIALIVAVGALIAWFLLPGEESIYGSQFRRTEIPENRLITDNDTENLCTITICCDTVFDYADKLEEGKAPYVPEDGEILPVTTVEFTPGETAFDILRRVCEASGLQIEYSWTPLYDSYYVEGINHLYEFDCGFESGWMYKVNDGFPNYGSSSYEVKSGDAFYWCYTCAGLGTDVGAVRMGE